MSGFKRAERKKSKARIGLVGPAGSGKTRSALEIAFGIGGPVAVIDTENGSADLYANLGEYDTLTIGAPFEVKKYLDAIHMAEQAGYNVLIIDSLTHAWAGEGGLLDKQGKIASMGKGNSYTAWREVTPEHNKLIEAILQSPMHIIATMRAKTEYVLSEDEKGRQVPKKVGMAPIQREGMDFEFTLVFDIDQAKHLASASKDRTNMFDGFCEVLSQKHGKAIRDWLESGKEVERMPSESDLATLRELMKAQGYDKDTAPKFLQEHTGKTKTTELTTADVEKLKGLLDRQPGMEG